MAAGGGGGSSSGDAATDRLFASQPVPAHFLHPAGRGGSDHFMPPFVPVVHQQQQQQVLRGFANLSSAAQFEKYGDDDIVSYRGVI